MTVKVLEMLRSQENFDLFWDNVLSKSKPLNVDDPKVPRQRGAPQRLEDFHGYGPAKPTTYETQKDIYRKHYFEALDQGDYQRYATLQELLLNAARKQPYDA